MILNDGFTTQFDSNEAIQKVKEYDLDDLESEIVHARMMYLRHQCLDWKRYLKMLKNEYLERMKVRN